MRTATLCLLLAAASNSVNASSCKPVEIPVQLHPLSGGPNPENIGSSAIRVVAPKEYGGWTLNRGVYQQGKTRLALELRQHDSRESIFFELIGDQALYKGSKLVLNYVADTGGKPSKQEQAPECSYWQEINLENLF